MANATFVSDLPPLPEYTLRPLGDLFPFISDFWLAILSPQIAYWIAAIFWEIVDSYDLFPQYRLHTPEEISARNLVSKWQVVRDVILEQILQLVVVAYLSLSDPEPVTGKQDYDVAVWATRIRLAQRGLPTLLKLVGLNAASLSQNMAKSHPLIAGALAGGHYPTLLAVVDGATGAGAVPTFATWEMVLAKLMYWVVVPSFQFMVAVVFMDTWQYMIHRAMHVNKWMYVHWHARHHRLYVPYAFGALYNHPVEGFFMDTCGSALSWKISGMTRRMGICYWVFSMVKTVDDHCGYVLPWNPLQQISGNNAAYHDIHHQSWGIKTNFSQPFFTFWDRVLGTMWTGDATLKYARDKMNAEKKSEARAEAKAVATKAKPSSVKSVKAQ